MQRSHDLDPLPAPGDIVEGKFEVERRLGRGGMGAVFAARHVRTGRRVALKWLLAQHAGDPQAVQRFLREARVAGRLRHPNVVDVFDVGDHEGSFYLVMELLEGELMSTRLGRGPLVPQEAVALFAGILRGVGAAHEAGVLHRDLKPDNVFLARGASGRAPCPKVLDFGISKLLGGPEELSLTRTGTVVGTPFYMSPEQLAGQKDIDRRADVYSLGVMLYEALSGRIPFEAETFSALVLKVATEDPTPLREVAPRCPRDLERAVRRAMARTRDRRYASVEELALALSAADLTAPDDLPLSSTRPSTPFPRPDPARLPSVEAPTSLDLHTRVDARPIDGLVDVQQVIRRCPEGASALGLFLRDLVAAVPPSKRRSLGALGDRRYQPFQRYPARHFLELLVAVARALHPELPLREGLRQVGHRAYPAFRKSMPGRVLYAVLGDDYERLFLLGARGFRTASSAGTCEAHLAGPRHVRYEFRAYPGFHESYTAGIVEGVGRHHDLDLDLDVRILDLFDADLDVRWER